MIPGPSDTNRMDGATQDRFQAEAPDDAPTPQAFLHAKSHDFAHQFLGQPRNSTVLTCWPTQCAMTTLIFLVRGLCIPAKIRQMIIGRIPIPMTAFHPWRARADKCFEDKPMHLETPT